MRDSKDMLSNMLISFLKILDFELKIGQKKKDEKKHISEVFFKNLRLSY